MKIDNRQKVLAIAAISAVILLASDSLIITPLTRLWKAHAVRIADLTKMINRGTLLLEREKSLTARWNGMRTNTLPSNDSVAQIKVLKAVDRWTKESGISFTSIKPQWKQNAEDYVTLECRADAFGDIQSLTRFLYELERDPLSLKIEDMEISSRDDTSQQLTLGVRFTGLVLTGAQP